MKLITQLKKRLAIVNLKLYEESVSNEDWVWVGSGENPFKKN